MVPPSSVRISRAPTYLMRVKSVFEYGTITLSGRPSQVVLLTQITSAGPRSLAATEGVSVDFLSSGYLDVSVPRVRSYKPMYSAHKYLVMSVIDTARVTITSIQVGFPIRRSLDQSLFPAPQSLSQGIASFIASCCQGIHQTPLSRLT